MVGLMGHMPSPTKEERKYMEEGRAKHTAKEQLEMRKEERDIERKRRRNKERKIRFKKKLLGNKANDEELEPYQELVVLENEDFYKDLLVETSVAICEEIEPENNNEIEHIMKFLDIYFFEEQLALLDVSDSYDGSVPDEPEELTDKELDKLNEIVDDDEESTPNKAEKMREIITFKY